MRREADVSVVIPAYEAERYLAAAIESVLAQTVTPREIIVFDDGSTDGTGAVAARFERVTVLRGAHLGVGAAMNRAIAAAAGRYIAVLDADDLWMPEKLSRQLEAMAVTPAPDIVLGAVEHFVSPDAPEDFRRRVDYPSGPMPGYSAGAMLVQRALFERVGWFAEDLRVGSFIDWFHRAEQLGVVKVLLAEVQLRRRLHGGNMSLRDTSWRSDFARIAKAAIERRRRGG